MTWKAKNPLTWALWDITWDMEKLSIIFQSAVLTTYLQVECNLQLQEMKAKKPLSLIYKSVL